MIDNNDMVKDSAIALDTLIREQNAAEDSSGRTLLDILADDLAELPPNAPRKQEYAWAVNRVARDVPKLTFQQTQRLCLFIESAAFPLEAFAEAFGTLLRSGLKSGSEIDKRAEIIRLLAEQGERFLPSRLMEETQVRKRFPWHWIDAMEAVDWPEAERAITATLTQEGKARSLLARLAFLWDKHGPMKESLGAWSRILLGAERQKLLDWMEHRNILSPEMAFGLLHEERNNIVESGLDSGGEQFLTKAVQGSQILISTPRYCI